MQIVQKIETLCAPHHSMYVAYHSSYITFFNHNPKVFEIKPMVDTVDKRSNFRTGSCTIPLSMYRRNSKCYPDIIKIIQLAWQVVVTIKEFRSNNEVINSRGLPLNRKYTVYNLALVYNVSLKFQFQSWLSVINVFSNDACYIIDVGQFNMQIHVWCMHLLFIKAEPKKKKVTFRNSGNVFQAPSDYRKLFVHFRFLLPS